MAANPYPLLALSLLLVATGAAMTTALFWVLCQVVSGRPLLPPWPQTPRLVPWGGGTIVAVTAAWLALHVVVPAGYVLVRPDAPPRPTATTPATGPTDRKTTEAPVGKTARPFTFAEQILLISLINGLLLLALPTGIILGTGARRADLGLVTGSIGRDLKLGALAFLTVTPVVMTINLYAQRVWKPQGHPLERMLKEGVNPGVIALAYLSAVVLAPAAEELMFRAVFQGWLRRLFSPPADPEQDFAALEGAVLTEVDPGGNAAPTSRFVPMLPPRIPRRILSVVLTSALFAAVHFEQMPAPLAIFPLSLALGLLYETTESLLPSVLLHALFNGLNTTLLVWVLLYQPG